MNADDIIKQGRELAGKLRDGAGEQVAQHEQQIKDALGKVVNFVNDKTGGKYADQVSKAVGYVEHGVDLLASDKRESATDEQAQGAGPASASTEGQPPPAASPSGAAPSGATPSGGSPPGAPPAAPSPPAPPPSAPAPAPPDTPAAGHPSTEPRIDPKGPPASG
jgi:hypothetical protein